MALARLDIPGLILYGGSIAPGRFEGRDVTIQDVFEAVGAHAAGTHVRRRPLRNRRPRLPGRRRVRRPVHRQHHGHRVRVPRPRADGQRRRAGDRSGQGAASRDAPARWSWTCCKRGVRPPQIITRDSLENAIAAVAATGGSTNAVLHLMAIAREAGVPLEPRGLRPHQRAHAAARRSQAGRTLRRHRPAPRRRHPPGRQPPQGRRSAARRRDDRQRPDDRRGSRRRRRNRRPGSRAAGRRVRSSRPAAW